MAFQLEQPRPISTYTLDSGLDAIRYGMDEIDLGIQQATVMAGGELISPEIYDMAIGKLNILKTGTKDKKLIMDIDEKVARYRIGQNNLVKRIQKEFDKDADGTDTETVSQIVNSNTQEYNDEVRRFFTNEYNREGGVGHFITASMVREREWAQRYAEEASDYMARKNKPSTELEKEAMGHSDKAEYYNNLMMMDETTRSQYKIFVKTDVHGNMQDYAVVEGRSGNLPSGYASKEDFMPVNGWSQFGMDVMLQKYDEDESGSARAYFNGVTIIEGEEGFDAPENLSFDTALSESRPATNINPVPGDFVTNPEGKAYLFGGYDGKSNEWNEITDPSITHSMPGGWENYNNRNIPLSFEQFEREIIDTIGKPLMLDELKAGQKSKFESDLAANQAEADRMSEFLGPGGEVAGRATGKVLGEAGKATGMMAEAVGKGSEVVLKGAGGVAGGALTPKNVVETGKAMGRTVADMTREGGKIFKGGTEGVSGFFRGLFNKR